MTGGNTSDKVMGPRALGAPKDFKGGPGGLQPPKMGKNARKERGKKKRGEEKVKEKERRRKKKREERERKRGKTIFFPNMWAPKFLVGSQQALKGPKIPSRGFNGPLLDPKRPIWGPKLHLCRPLGGLRALSLAMGI